MTALRPAYPPAGEPAWAAGEPSVVEGGRVSEHPIAVEFDGQDFLLLSADPIGISDSENWTAELWFWPHKGSGDQALLSNGNGTTTSGIAIVLNAEGAIRLYSERSDGAQILDITSTETVTWQAWNHLLVTKAAGDKDIALNGVSGFSQSIFQNNQASDFTKGQMAIGAMSNGGKPFHGLLYRVWLGLSELDPQAAGNIERFRNSDGTPVELGKLGIVGNITPVVYLAGAASSWHVSPNGDNYSLSSARAFLPTGHSLPSDSFGYGISDNLTVVDKSHYQVVQRTVGGTGASVAFSGTYSSISPSQIDARVLDFDTGVEVTAWEVIDPAPTGGNWSGTVSVPDGNGYRIQVRASGEVTTGRARWGVGLILALEGQSNQARMLTDAGDGLDSDNVQPVADTISASHFTGVAWGKIPHANGVRSLVAELAQGLDGSAIGVMSRAGGGLSVERYTSAGDEGGANSAYTNFVADVTALGGAIEYFVWDQGEEDVNASLRNSDYGSAISEMWSDIKAAINTSGNKPTGVLTSIGYSPGAPGGSTAFQDVVDGQMAWVAESDVLHGASRLDLAMIDGFHYETTSFSKTGERLARSILHDLELASSPGIGPTLASASIAGTTVTLTYVRTDAGPKLVDNGNLRRQFSWYDGGVHQGPPSAATLVNSDTQVELVIGSLPNGAVAIRQIYGNDVINYSVSDLLTDNSSHLESSGLPVNRSGLVLAT